MRSNTGDVTLRGASAATSITVIINTGDVKLDMADAQNIFVETNTGDVTGCLVPEMIIFASSNTGDVSVPKSTSGGKCEIKSRTGDIVLVFADVEPPIID